MSDRENTLIKFKNYIDEHTYLPKVTGYRISNCEDRYIYTFSGEEYKLWNIITFLLDNEFKFKIGRSYDANTHELNDLTIAISDFSDLWQELLNEYY
ncbi:hypothetical protein [Companilactobacillus ginsenosidimutans]|uniref:Uncharacterized protein n=1 Tax=Companilactobacillus ginsenosidimutans TaxID=1007676 RepID=A0A0H4QLY3_9LACO|nr:hypothetical protein [Companilactobacillus ginsenosidimutans]AKP68116.1 hypothetical protein ABM34_11610 [Companilactobacillus ginsenosidimutans]